MKKRFEVYLSPIAENRLHEILDFLVAEWSEKSKLKFLDAFLKKVDLISIHPKSTPESRKFPGLYWCVIDKHNSFFYRVVKQEIQIIIVVDNRMDPAAIDNNLKIQFK